jgi:putative thioredoxin
MGGVRFDLDLTLEEMKALSAWMSVKNAAVNLPFGGARGWRCRGSATWARRWPSCSTLRSGESTPAGATAPCTGKCRPHMLAGSPRPLLRPIRAPTMQTSLPDSALSYDVTDLDFEAAVIERSMEVPVLLDCWAPWCGPCKSLKPVLEKLVQAYGGQFVLAKLNSDECPGVAQALQLRSIPHVFLLKDGQVVDQFTGALPEGQVRAFLDKHVKPQVSPVDQLREQALADPANAEALLRQALALQPGHVEVTLDLADRVLARGALDDAQALLDRVAPTARNDRHAALVKRIELARNRPDGDPAQLAARIAANPKDFEARFALAALQVYEGDFNAAFDQLLEVVLRDKAEWREKARLQLVEWFDVCGDAAAVSRGRRYLGMYLN